MVDSSPDRPEPATFYDPSDYRPDSSVGYLMRRIVTSILVQADRELAAFDLTHAQWVPLFKMVLMQEAGGYTAASLARDLQLDPGATTRLLDRLEAKNLVRRERSSTDRRVVHLVLTAEGKAAASQVPGVLCTVLNRHLAGFSEAEWLTLRGLLERMVANGESTPFVPACASGPSSNAGEDA